MDPRKRFTKTRKVRLRPLRETLLALAGAAADGNTAYAESWTDADVNDADEQKRTDAKIS